MSHKDLFTDPVLDIKTVELIQPKNIEQEIAIREGRYYIEHGKPDEYFLIAGKAGTGKTTIAQAIIAPYLKKNVVLVCAVAHQAKLNLYDKLILGLGDSQNIVAKSIAQALGMSMDLETGRFFIDKSFEGIPPIRRAKIIVIDEGSMINEEGHMLIMTLKKKNAKVIYLGDIRQLPPIREKNSEFEDMPSPIFATKKYAILKERIRQGEESPILPFSDFFGDNTRLKHPVKNPAPPQARKSIITEKGAVVFADDLEDVIIASMPLFRHAVENKKKNVVRVTTFRNNARMDANKTIRRLLFADEAS